MTLLGRSLKPLAVRNVCVEIPKEGKTEEDVRHDKVGHLRMSLYGTRDAP